MSWLRWLIALGALNAALGVAMLTGGYGDAWLNGCYEFAGSRCVWEDRANEPVHLLHYGESDAGEVRDVERTVLREVPRKVDVLLFESRELENVFPASSAMRWALMLRCLRQGGAAYAAMSADFGWIASTYGLEGEVLRSEAEAFAFAGFGLRGEQSKNIKVIPSFMENAALARVQVKGDCSRLPSMSCLLTPWWHESPHQFPVLWSVDSVANNEMFFADSGEGKSMPLLVRWLGRLYPTLPLRLALARSGAASMDVYVEVGKCLRIRDMEWPLDECGRIALPAERAHRKVSLGEILQGAEGWRSAEVVVVEEKTPETLDHAVLMADTLSVLMADRSFVRETVKEKVARVELHEWNPLAYWGWVLLVQGLLILVFPRCNRSVQAWGERVVWLSVPALALALLWQMVWLPLFGLASGVAVASVMGRCLRFRETRGSVRR